MNTCTSNTAPTIAGFKYKYIRLYSLMKYPAFGVAIKDLRENNHRLAKSFIYNSKFIFKNFVVVQ
ncbi:hypothetical protein [Candidatus Kryptobacter tengchongensis]|uniref:hypothetical protein n=1 Tax=Kryptobacter tengchongensis TaxID=1643429 RepID=UPI00117D3F54|nr:hypothetical protein [Candidatus Kryptobacter tengchongensis]